VASWLLVAAAAQTGSGGSQPAECDVAGFVLKWKKLPQRRLESQAEAVLHTLHIDNTANLRQAPNVHKRRLLDWFLPNSRYYYYYYYYY
jgi:hypothetical protein